MLALHNDHLRDSNLYQSVYQQTALTTVPWLQQTDATRDLEHASDLPNAPAITQTTGFVRT